MRHGLVGALITIGGLSAVLSAAPGDHVTAACPVTSPPARFTTPAPYPLDAPRGNFWHGDERFWTMLPADGRWYGLPRNSDGLRQKVFWWYPGFDGAKEPVPDFELSGRQLDGPAVYVLQRPATNARNADFGGWTILTGIDVPNPGCWEFTGQYRGQTLSFVLRVN